MVTIDNLQENNLQDQQDNILRCGKEDFWVPGLDRFVTNNLTPTSEKSVMRRGLGVKRKLLHSAFALGLIPGLPPLDPIEKKLRIGDQALRDLEKFHMK